MKAKTFQQISNIDIKLLKIFKTICECSSFKSAESILGISSSAMSLYITDLEKRIGFKLCQRGRAGFCLTKKGEELLEYIEVFLTSIGDFHLKINKLHNQLNNELNIGVIKGLATLPACNITNTLIQLNDEYSEVKINIRIGTLSEIEREVLNGQIHIGVIPFISAHPGLNYLNLYQEQSYLYCGNKHPLFFSTNGLSTEDLKQWDAVTISHNKSVEEIKLHQLLKCKSSTTDIEGIAFLILTGSFVGFLPDHYASKWVSEGTMRSILETQVTYKTQICLITKKCNSNNMILNYFLEKINIKF